MADISRDELTRLDAELAALRTTVGNQSTELLRYRQFWEKKWPRTLWILGIGAAILAAGTGIGVVMGFGLLGRLTRQVREVTRSRRLESVLTLYGRVNDGAAIEDRRRLYDAFAENQQQFRTTPLAPEIMEAVERILYTFSELGLLVDHGLLEPSLVQEWLHSVPARTWIIMRDYVLWREGMAGTKNIAFRSLARLGLQSWIDNNPGRELVIYHTQDRSRVARVSAESLTTLLKELSGSLPRRAGVRNYLQRKVGT